MSAEVERQNLMTPRQGWDLVSPQVMAVAETVQQDDGRT